MRPGHSLPRQIAAHKSSKTHKVRCGTSPGGSSPDSVPGRLPVASLRGERVRDISGRGDIHCRGHLRMRSFLCLPRLAVFVTRKLCFRVSPSELSHGCNGSPLFCPALRCAGRWWGLCSLGRCVPGPSQCVQCDRDIARTEVDTKVFVFVIVFRAPASPLQQVQTAWGL